MSCATCMHARSSTRAQPCTPAPVSTPTRACRKTPQPPLPTEHVPAGGGRLPHHPAAHRAPPAEPAAHHTEERDHPGQGRAQGDGRQWGGGQVPCAWGSPARPLLLPTAGLGAPSTLLQPDGVTQPVGRDGTGGVGTPPPGLCERDLQGQGGMWAWGRLGDGSPPSVSTCCRTNGCSTTRTCCWGSASAG